MMRNSFLFGLLCLFVVSACSQKNYAIQNGRAYFKLLLPGNVPVDDNGIPTNKSADTLRVLYLEVKWKTAPAIDLVTYEGRRYSASVFPPEGLPEMVGISKTSHQKVVLQPAPGNSLWKIELQPAVNNNNARVISPANVIHISGTLNGKPFSYKVKKEEELEQDSTY